MCALTQIENIILDKILEHLVTSPRAVPDFKSNSLNNNGSSRNSPCNIYGRSPNDCYYKRVPAAATRKTSYADRSGSPCLAGYGVIKPINCTILFVYIIHLFLSPTHLHTEHAPRIIRRIWITTVQWLFST